MFTPNSMPAHRAKRVIPMAQLHAHCQDGGRCKGPGCVVSTGKTSGKRSKGAI